MYIIYFFFSLLFFIRYCLDSAFQLEFNFPGGIQGPKHPKPGKRFHGDGRVAFLPDNTEGNKVLRLFRKGWKRKLLFTIGYSQTRQIDDVLIYNGMYGVYCTDPAQETYTHSYSAGVSHRYIFIYAVYRRKKFHILFFRNSYENES